jgi:hypothetical protein
MTLVLALRTLLAVHTFDVEIGASSLQASEHLAASLEKTHSVMIYFMSRTEEYSARTDQLKTNSTTRIYRNCGADCRMFMASLVRHLSQATPSNCLAGQESVLIEMGAEPPILYSHSGKLIEYEGACYVSKENVNRILKSPEFLFH